MDHIATISPAKDSSLAMLLEAQKRGHALWHMELSDLRLRDGVPLARAHRLLVEDDYDNWHELQAAEEMNLGDFDVILMRKDPPFDMEFVYSTYILQRAEEAGALVVNRPASLRDMNEKAYTAWFPECCPATLITRSMDDIRAFRDEHGSVVVKPLDGMGGRSIFVVREGDKNASVIFETLTDNGTQFAIAQQYIPEITAGDKRVILVDGVPVDYSLARVPPADDNRGNLVAGAQPEARPLTDRDRWICEQVGPVLKENGVLFAGLDIIGDYLTEINVTSPTGIRELQKLAGIDPAAELFDRIEELRG